MKYLKKMLGLVLVTVLLTSTIVFGGIEAKAESLNGGVYLDPSTVSPATSSIYLSENNLRFTASSSPTTSLVGNAWTNTSVSSGKWYWEVDLINYPAADRNNLPSFGIVSDTDNYLIAFDKGYNNCGASNTFGLTVSSKDIIGILLDLDNYKIDFLKNGVLQGTISINSSTWGKRTRPFIGLAAPNADIRVNFGTSSFKYADKVPSDYRPYSLSEGIKLTGSLNGNQETLRWNAIGGATSYNIKYSTTSGGPYTTFANVSGTSYIVKDLPYGTALYYVVSAVAYNGSEGPNSNEVAATSIAGSSAILEITMTNGTIKEYSLTALELNDFLTWYDNRSDGIGRSYYKIPQKSNVKPFLTRNEFLSYDKIYSFEVKEYNE